MNHPRVVPDCNLALRCGRRRERARNRLSRLRRLGGIARRRHALLRGRHGRHGHRRRLDNRQIDQRRVAVVADPEWPQIVFIQIEHANDVRRQRQHDVGLRGLLAVVREQPPDDRQIAQAGNAFHDRPLVVANEAGEKVRLAVAKPDRRGDLAVAECRQPAEACSGQTRDDDLQRQRHIIVVVRPRRDVDVDANVLACWNEVIGCCATPPVAMGEKVVTGTGT